MHGVCKLHIASNADKKLKLEIHGHKKVGLGDVGTHVFIYPLSPCFWLVRLTGILLFLLHFTINAFKRCRRDSKCPH